MYTSYNLKSITAVRAEDPPSKPSIKAVISLSYFYAYNHIVSSYAISFHMVSDLCPFRSTEGANREMGK